MVTDTLPSCDEDSEQELTNLTWLTELRNQSLTWPDSIQPIFDDDSADRRCHRKFAHRIFGKSSEYNENILHKKPTPTERYEIFLEKIQKDRTQYNLAAEAYQTNTSEKPPFNYSHIIGMAIFENGRMTLQQICLWIESKFAYFRIRKKWNNSIRHNLSLHHCFRKIDRSKYEKGKGGYWELGIDPKKCDRKRVRNRKNKKNLFIDEQKTRINYFEYVPSLQVDRSCKPCSTQLPQVVSSHKDLKKHQALASSLLTSNETQIQNYDTRDSIQLQDVFIADTTNCGKLLNSSNILMTADNQLSSIIINTLTAGTDIPDRNAPEAHEHLNTFVENEIIHPSENVIITSQTSPGVQIDGDQPNVIVEQVEPCYMISTAETSFRPYIDGIDEAFQYLRSMDSRCDDLFDNLLDISVSDY